MEENLDCHEFISEEEAIKELEFLTWDPDFTKLTPMEQIELERALEDKETIPHDAINWD